MTAGRFASGTQVRCRTTKWGGAPHWTYPGRYLGADGHGDWVGFPAGTLFTRPGATYRAPCDQVALVPHLDHPLGPGFLAAFHARQAAAPVRVYVDVTTAPHWSGTVAAAVDLDLDVVCDRDGRVHIDDEDEFERHRALLGYPEEVVRAALDQSARLRGAVTRGRAPFDGTAGRWLAELAGPG